jgi:acetyl-CoA C-acetyltransferase
MREVVIVEAVRTPIGKRNGGLSSVHPADLLSEVQRSVVTRSGIDPAEVEQVVGGCVSQVGEQSYNVTRTAWLTAGLPLETAATTVDTQCGSSQQATNFATSLVASGVVDVAVACGVESMSRIPIGSNGNKKLGLGVAIPKTYFGQYEMTSQFEGAERIADKWGVTREATDAFGLRSQQLAAQAWAEGRFDTQVIPSMPLTSTTRASPRARTTPSPATRACARPRSRSSPRSSRSPARTACTPPGRRRRSPTAPPQCC